MSSFSYNQKIQRIEAIIKSLQEDELALEKAIELYEEAQRLLDECEQYLSSLEEKYFKKVENRSNLINDVSVEGKDL